MTEPYHSPAVHELVMDVDGVVAGGGGWYRSGGYRIGEGFYYSTVTFLPISW